MEWITILPNLSIGVVAVLSLVWFSIKSQDTMQKMHTKHMEEVAGMHTRQLEELNDRERAIRDVEREVRQSITTQLVKNTELMQRVLQHLNGR
jgi:hypothetical protein